MRGILAAHQLPPTQHLSQSMNIEWPPPPAFGVRRGEGGWQSRRCSYLLLIFSLLFLPACSRILSQQRHKKFRAPITSNFPSVHNAGVFVFYSCFFFLQSPLRLPKHVLFFHNEKVAEGRVPIAIHFAFICFLLVFDIHSSFAQQAWSKKK